eukprot:jgi/Tetstr1/424916/TSEL_015410.t1
MARRDGDARNALTKTAVIELCNHVDWCSTHWVNPETPDTTEAPRLVSKGLPLIRPHFSSSFQRRSHGEINTRSPDMEVTIKPPSISKEIADSYI